MDARRAEEIFSQFFGGEDPFADLMGGGGGGVRMHTFGGSPMGGRGGGGSPMGGGMPGMMFGGMPMGGMQQSMAGMGGQPPPLKRRSQVEANARLDALQPNTAVTIFGLVNAAQLNGDTARVVEFDQAKDRYVVRLDGGDTLSVKPSNLQQLISGVILVGIEGDASLNGKSGTLLKFDKDKERYTVRYTQRRVCRSLCLPTQFPRALTHVRPFCLGWLR
jgi:hypothetical protein